MELHRLAIPRRPRAWLAGAALLALFASAPGLAARARALACTMLWGHSPTLECLWHAEFAKEGLAVDNSQRSFSVGYGQPGNNSLPRSGSCKCATPRARS